jgi:hypothetical protein
MSSLPKPVLTSSPSQPSRQGDGLFLSNGFVCNGLHASIDQQSQEDLAYGFAIGEKERTRHFAVKNGGGLSSSTMKNHSGRRSSIFVLENDSRRELRRHSRLGREL